MVEARDDQRASTIRSQAALTISAKPFGRIQVGERRRFAPLGFGQFLVERNLAGDPARRERQNHEMPFDPAGGIARDRLAIAGERHRLDVEAGFLADLADDGFLKVSPSSTPPPGSV